MDMNGHKDAQALIESLPSTLWSSGSFDVGHCSAVIPVSIEVAEGSHVFCSQYRWVPEADDGMEDALTGLWKSGVLETSTSSWSTPLRTVLKADGESYRIAHDLCPVNDVATTSVLPVPDPHCMLSTISPERTWFTAIDLANAFFCIPLHPDSRHLFVF